MKLFIRSLSMASILFLTEFSSAQWIQSNGPNGGFITALGFNPTAAGGPTLFAGTLGGGNFRSTDNGANWISATTGLSFGGTYFGGNAFAAKGTNIFTATSAGVFLSTNNGTSWTEVDNGITNTGALSLLVNSNDIFAGTNGGAFHSTNDGTSWTKIDSGLTSHQVNAFVVSGTSLFAGTQDSGVFVSTNSGAHWTKANGGIENQTIRALAVDGTTLFAGSFGGVFRSTNNGIGWTSVSAIVTNSLVVNGGNVYAGGSDLIVSTDNGDSWTRVDSGLGGSFVYALTATGSALLAGTGTFYAGVYASTNGGALWTESDHGLTATDVRSFASHPNGSGGYDLFAGTNENGVYRSGDNGGSWTPVNNGISHASVSALGFIGGTLLAGENVSTDNGQSWTPAGDGFTASGILHGFAVDSPYAFAAAGNGVFFSADGGQHWAHRDSGISNPNLNAIAFSAPYLFAGGNGTMYRSTNDGQLWTSAGGGLSGVNVTSIAFLGTNVFAGTSNGVYRSTNNGGSWSAVNTGISIPSVYSLIAIDTDLVAGTATGIYVTKNGGTNWTAISTGMPNLFNIFLPTTNALAAIPNGSGGTDMFAGTFLLGAWKRPFSQLTGVRPTAPFIPEGFALAQNYPNPFNPASTINYSLPAPARVSLKIYNVLGELVETLVDGMEEPGFKTVEWSAGTNTSGVYFYKLSATSAGDPKKSFTQVRKMVLLK